MNDQPGPTGPGGRANILDVAALAGVSAATVSRSLRGMTKVAPETRQRVLDAARELSYATTVQPAGGRGARRTVAVIVPFITRWFFSTVTAAAADLLRGQNFDVLLYHLGGVEERDRFFDQMPLAGRVDGILTLSMPLTERHTLSLRALGIPLVSVGSTIPGSPSVGIDEAGAGRAAANHLLHLRHEHIGYIAAVADDPRFEFASSSLRRVGFGEALSRAGLTLADELVAAGPHGLEGGASAMGELLTRTVLPTAVFAEYDELAIGALWVLRRAGLRVPEDISVISVDDHEMASMLDLTTMAQGVPEQGSLGAQLLMDVLDGGAVSVEPVVIPTRLVLRGTTGPAPRPLRRGQDGNAAGGDPDPDPETVPRG